VPSAPSAFPVTLPDPADPVSLLESLPPGPGRLLLESGPAGPPELRRWSFAAAEPFLLFTARGRQVAVQTEAKTRYLEGDPFALLQTYLERYRTEAAASGLPLAGGAIGYIAYDAGRQVERLPSLAADDLGLPEFWFGFYDAVLALDHNTGQVWAAQSGHRRAESTGMLRRWVSRLKEISGSRASAAPLQPDPAGSSLSVTFTRNAYEAAVRRAIEYIAAGDIFQVNLAQRFSMPYPAGGWAYYRQLRHVNPAPFAAFLDGGHWQVACASPERFLLVEPSGRVETRPIKGTRPRGAGPDEDRAMADQLLASDKEKAELMMIVDLERNDLGRVCRFGSIRVPALRMLEAYPTVWHTAAIVEGDLRAGAGVGSLLRATFPGGSITGAPKVRAMEIIEEMEPVRRGIYTGAIGYLGFDGRCDLNVAIRTAVISRGVLHFHVGAGVVADSDPAREYEETLAKGGGLLRALGVPTA
jgi:para-aminobenzoate synthetase component I